MKSYAAVASHPIHAMIIPFPLAFLAGALVFDGVALVGGLPTFWTVGHYMAAAGIIMALIAAIPGLIDYLETVPPKSSAKKRATVHMTVNLTAVALFALAWLNRSVDTPSWAVLGAEAIAGATLSVGGWLGGTLVYRNQIGVDHRYANAGRWREETVTVRPGDMVTVARFEELKVGQMKLVHLNDRRIVLARTAAGYTAFDDHCTHKGGSLADGCLVDEVVQCPWHGSQFDVTSGAVHAGPAKQEIATYPVRVDGNDVKLQA
jgi:nitrite reductase/ring-hydroxylating ferredoxin subunit/uncharacterized membrane protein